MKSMRGTVKISIAVTAAGLVFAIALPARPALRSALPTQPAGRDASSATASFAGTLGCSARACHGGSEPVKDSVVQQNEYTTCLAHDKHTQAYQVLKGERAKRIAENLAITNDGGKEIPAHRDERCLACHVTPALAFQPDPTKEADTRTLNLREAGVSCEACHGPATKKDKPWLALHTAPGQWREKFKDDPTRKEEHGFTDLTDLSRQARMCASCHVGAAAGQSHGLEMPARDLNHDLMAAGHPRMTFEFVAFRANMPPHWNTAAKKQQRQAEGTSHAEFVAKVWAVGRVETARAQLELTAHRAEQAKDDKVPWPEFAEYRCFACHANLPPDWRAERPKTTRVPGSLSYDPWHGALLPVIEAGSGSQFNVAMAYDRLTRLMAEPTPNNDEVIKEARLLAGVLDGWGKALAESKADPAKLRLALAASMKTPPLTWEEGMQYTLAAAALKREVYDNWAKNRSQPKPADLAALDQLFQALSYPPGQESAAGLLGPFPSRKEFTDPFGVVNGSLK